MKELSDIFNALKGGLRQAAEKVKRSGLGKALTQRFLDDRIVPLINYADDIREDKIYPIMGSIWRAYQRHYLTFPDMADLMRRSIWLLPRDGAREAAAYGLVSIIDNEHGEGRVNTETAALNLFDVFRWLAPDVRSLPPEEKALVTKWVPLCLTYGEKAQRLPDHLLEMEEIYDRLPREIRHKGPRNN